MNRNDTIQFLKDLAKGKKTIKDLIPEKNIILLPTDDGTGNFFDADTKQIYTNQELETMQIIDL